MTHKYHAQPTVVDGIRFDSKAEANRYCDLKLMEKGGLIRNLELQPKFELQPLFRKNGRTIRAITYTADFRYWDVTEDREIIEDVKGIKTQMFELRRKMFEYKYPELTLKIVS